MNLIDKIRKYRDNSSLRDNEDLSVIDFIDSINDGRPLHLLEVGSGECRFAKKISSLYPNIMITCIEINPELAQIAIDAGFEVINDSILNVRLLEEYDIVHCSHVIEHFGYPQITNVLDFLVSATKIGMFLVIRSPLMHESFYNDIDHVRPYPPQSIKNYFYYSQQQYQGKAKFVIKSLWYRTRPKEISKLKPWNICCHIKPLAIVINFFRERINSLYEWSWINFRVPASMPNGYVMILKIEGR